MSYSQIVRPGNSSRAGEISIFKRAVTFPSPHAVMMASRTPFDRLRVTKQKVQGDKAEGSDLCISLFDFRIAPFDGLRMTEPQSGRFRTLQFAVRSLRLAASVAAAAAKI